ncbi:hypothetical protein CAUPRSCDRAFT_12249 [Caulochytrium protostelioides]|uniref:Secreted protein n=1 Tax=Caulochytrium protostelioides TaxID=1555241 RepID=A0A4P9WX97_9FUNG|nr:hypothetical protein CAUPRSCDRAFT_12249 [Caulochytrium protostelioides]
MLSWLSFFWFWHWDAWMQEWASGAPHEDALPPSCGIDRRHESMRSAGCTPGCCGQSGRPRTQTVGLWPTGIGSSRRGRACRGPGVGLRSAASGRPAQNMARTATMSEWLGTSGHRRTEDVRCA